MSFFRVVYTSIVSDSIYNTLCLGGLAHGPRKLIVQISVFLSAQLTLAGMGTLGTMRTMLAVLALAVLVLVVPTLFKCLGT